MKDSLAWLIFLCLLTAVSSLLVRAQDPPLRPPAETQEKHLQNLNQLTFGGQNAEAYFSYDGNKIIFQSTRPPFECDQILSMNVDGSDVKLLNSGKGRTTCGFFFPDGKRIIYASTHLAGDACPPAPDRSQGYVWPIYPSYEIFSANVDGSGLKRLTKNPGYDAEGTISPDGNTIVYRAYHPKTRDKLIEYESLLKQNLIKPTRAEIFMMSADGSHKRQLTNNGAANWAPFLHPNNRQIIFSSNVHDPDRGSFSLYLINVDGTGLERVTYGARFDSYPMFSRDGTKLVFASTRNGKELREFNIFIADWVP